LPLELNPRIKSKLDRLPAGPEKSFLKDLLKYEIERSMRSTTEWRYKDDIMKIVEKYYQEFTRKDIGSE